MAAKTKYGSVGYRFSVLTVLACTLGVFVSLATIAFVECVLWLNDVLLVSPRTRVQVHSASVLTWVTILTPTLGGLLVGVLLHQFSKERRPLGPPDAIRAVQLRTPLPSPRSGILSTLAAVTSLGCGASVGQYGPLVYLGALAGSFADRLHLRIPNLQAIAIACGVAAAISTAFNAPIAGLVFAHEVVLRHYSLQAFAPTTVAAATGYVVANVIFERPALFLVEFAGVENGYEFALFALLGVACAFLAVGFMQLTLLAARTAQKSTIPAILRPALAGLLVGVVALGLPDVLGVGKEALRFATIEGAFESWELVLLVIAKTGLTAICIGFGFAGGVFSPSLLIGILFGGLFWALLQALGIPNSGIAVYAICGMMALTSPVIGAPLTTILIVFELTHNYDLTIAAMVGVVFANLLAYRIFGRSLFDVQLKGKGVDLSTGRDRALLEYARVVDQKIDQFLQFKSHQSVASAIERFIANGCSEAVVTDDDNVFLGVLRLQDSIGHTSDSVSTIMRDSGFHFDETTSLWKAMYDLGDFVGEAIPVIDSKSGQLLGVLTEADLITAYMKTVHELRREENAAV